MRPMTETDHAFDKWYRVNGNPAHSLPALREAFLAGWEAAEKQITAGEFKGTSLDE